MARRKRPQKKRANKIRAVSAKEVSVLAWIQDAFSNVLLVRQTCGRQLWSLPGGKVRASEALAQALRREIKEEIGLTVKSAENLDIFDRPQKKRPRRSFPRHAAQGPAEDSRRGNPGGLLLRDPASPGHALRTLFLETPVSGDSAPKKHGIIAPRDHRPPCRPGEGGSCHLREET